MERLTLRSHLYLAVLGALLPMAVFAAAAALAAGLLIAWFAARRIPQ